MRSGLFRGKVLLMIRTVLRVMRKDNMSGFTKEIIAKTFTELLDEKPMSKITVKDIVERCGVNRNTFYYHFKDIPDVVGYFEKEVG